MTLGENIHNAFVVVFESLKSIEKLISMCRNELDVEKYHMPEKHFMRWSSDQSWEGWIYWSFILLFQRKEGGGVMEIGCPLMLPCIRKKLPVAGSVGKEGECDVGCICIFVSGICGTDFHLGEGRD